MGWVESPSYFTILRETACDLTNSHLGQRQSYRPPSTVHRLEAVAATPPPDTVEVKLLPLPTGLRTDRTRGRRPVASSVVYVDDFLLLAQTAHQQQEVLRAALTSIDAVFRSLSKDEPPHRKEPASVSKMRKGDAAWSTRKRIFGWEIDTDASTLSLPAHRLDRLYELLDYLAPPRKRATVKFWHKLLGELRSMAPAMPGARGLFSLLQHALQSAQGHRIRVTRAVQDMATDFRRLLADSLHQRPTRLQELVPLEPTFVGASDASGQGMGGV